MKSMVITTTLLMATCTVAMAQDKVNVPKQALQEMSFLVDNWKARGTTNGEEFSGTYFAHSAPGKHCLILRFDWTGESRVNQSGIGGWSPDQKQYVGEEMGRRAFVAADGASEAVHPHVATTQSP